MTLPYLLRLLCLCSAAFYFIFFALSLTTRVLEYSAIRLAHKMRPRGAARFLLAIRALPTAVAGLVVLGLCLPSYLWLEPGSTKEFVGVLFVSVAMIGAAVGALSILRSLRAVVSTEKFIRLCRKAGERLEISGETQSILVMDGESTILATVGILRPQLVISRNALNALNKDQLAAALRHEGAHRSSRENLKRLFLFLIPDVVPFHRLNSRIDLAWAQFSEWAADDSAVAGDSRHSASLAETLVRVARLSAPSCLAPLCTSLVPADQDLSARVERLLHVPSPHLPRPRHRIRALVVSVGLVSTILVTFFFLQPATLHSVHELLERLTH